MDPSPYPGPAEESSACVVHPEKVARYRCDGCGAVLCEDCISPYDAHLQASKLDLCSLCGERAVPLGGDATFGVPVDGDFFTTEVVRHGFQPAAATATPFSVHLTHHVVVPVSIIAMVSALLFFLVDLRSIFLYYGEAIKWLGFWFITASVLIARYGKVSASEENERQAVYQVLLGVSTAVVLFVEPWERGPRRYDVLLVNLVILGGVWYFAQRLTASLAQDKAEGPRTRGLKLYGTERLELEAWEAEQDDVRIRVKRRLAEAERQEADAHGNPNAAVARLVVAGLAIFALGEPLVLAGPVAVGIRALVDTIVFLLAAGVLLAAGSTIGTLRHARRLGGRFHEGLVPLRVATAGVFLVLLLIVALQVPGVAWRGSAELQPKGHRADVESKLAEAVEESLPESGGSKGGGDSDPADSDATQNVPSESKGGKDSDAASSPAGQVLQGVLTVGRFLWLPFVLAVLVATLFVLARLAPFLKPESLRGWRAAVARFARSLGRRRAKKKKKRSGRGSKADLDINGLSSMTPREAVVTGYTRVLATLVALGHPRPEGQTPQEFLDALPLHLRHLKKPLGVLTGYYGRAAYGVEDLEEQDRTAVLTALREVKARLPAPAFMR